MNNKYTQLQILSLSASAVNSLEFNTILLKKDKISTQMMM